MQKISGLQKFEVRFESWDVGSFCGRGAEVYEQLKKRKEDMCCLQESKDLDLLVSTVSDVGGLEITMKWEMLEF